MPPSISPMLATRWPAPFDDAGWWFEVKWDGYRAILSNESGQIRARSRRGLDLVEAFPELDGLPVPDGAVIDGEIVAFDADGRPSFDLIQKRTGFGGRGTGARVAVNFVAFDLLQLGEENLLDAPLEDRRAELEGLNLESPIVVTDTTRGEGIALFEAVKEQGMEGVVGKRSGSRYLPGRRSPDWRKIAVRRRMRALVGGWTEGEGGRSSTFGSLLLGLRDGEHLRFVGAVGSGFNERSLGAIREALDQIAADESPFDRIAYPGRLHFVHPGLVVNVEFKEWTADKHLRAPVFQGVEVVDPTLIDWQSEGPDAN